MMKMRNQIVSLLLTGAILAGGATALGNYARAEGGSGGRGVGVRVGVGVMVGVEVNSAVGAMVGVLVGKGVSVAVGAMAVSVAKTLASRVPC